MSDLQKESMRIMHTSKAIPMPSECPEKAKLVDQLLAESEPKEPGVVIGRVHRDDQPLRHYRRPGAL